MFFKILSRTTVMMTMITALALPIKAANALDLENTLYLDLEGGRVVIEMLPDLAPNHVVRIKELTREKFYDGLKFHRVIEDFMAQTGDPKGDGTGGSGRKIRSEFSSTPHTRGIVSMARAQSPHSADSQFFIVTADSSFLDNKYTVWGRVVEGMEFVDMIKKGMGRSGMVRGEPDTIIQMQVAADAP